MDKNILDHLADNWRRSGIENGDLVLLHSSLKRVLTDLSLKYNTKVTPQHIFDSVVQALGPEGTLILPLYNFDFPNTKFFDIRNTPSQMGALTEIGRNHPDAVRTGHPIYSFAIIGKRAHEFQNIDNVSGYGADSPFAKIKELDGKIAVIDLTDQNSMTSYHFVEEQNQVDYRYFKDFEGQYIDEDGKESTKTYSLYVRDIERGVTTDVNRMMDYLWEIGAFKGDQAGQNLGMRTIDFNTLYNETQSKIKSGDAINYLYSITTS